MKLWTKQAVFGFLGGFELHICRLVPVLILQDFPLIFVVLCVGHMEDKDDSVNGDFY
jgi:hypothetical protein